MYNSKIKIITLCYKYFIYLFLFIILSGCNNHKKEVIIYTSVDQVYSSKIFKDFENKTGIHVLPVFDTEASKGVGLEKRLLIEKDHPRADIFWNSEPIRTERLTQQGIFQSYQKVKLPNYKNNIYFDSKKRWFGIGERARVIIVNTKLLSPKAYPKTLDDLWKIGQQHKIAISSPFIGTAATHFAALYSKLGKQKFNLLLKGMQKNHISYLAGNSVVKDAVASGKYAIGIVDSDDAKAGIKAGLPLKEIYYNQKYEGVFSIFGTVAMLKDAPHTKEAKLFIDYLLTQEIEKKLIKLGAVQFSVLDGSKHKNKTWTKAPSLIQSDLKTTYMLFKKIL